MGVHEFAEMWVKKAKPKETNARENLLVVALELFSLVVAGRVTLPGAVEEAIGLGYGILVQGMIPGRRLTVATGTTSECRGQERIVHEVSAIGILGADKSTV